ncbi:MAG: phenylalanine--tRNA ligase subunit alpha [Bacteriovoracia bacterium]
MSEQNQKQNTEQNVEAGSIHPLNRVVSDIVQIFSEMGFEVATGTEIEDEKHNFDDLNVPKDHPARDMQDTFWLKDFPGHLMRTHTSGVQIHYMKENQPPFKIVAPGKVYRYEATDKTHEVQFHQIEGLVVGKGINLGHLKKALNIFVKKFYGDDVETRLRPGYFPFVEPGVEVDMKRGDGDWIEMLGAGMVHPNVLKNCGLDPEEYSGFAFGIGLDRVAMLKYGIDDVRKFYDGDLRMINQF